MHLNIFDIGFTIVVQLATLIRAAAATRDFRREL
jgi:hypothetical protein